MSSVTVGWSPHTAQFGSLRTVILRYSISSASYTMSEPTRGSPIPVISLIASLTWMEPIDAHSTPRTPPSAHDGTMPGGGGSGYRSRYCGPYSAQHTLTWPSHRKSDPQTYGLPS